MIVADDTQRWSPEDFLRTLVEAEITARDESNARNRLKAAAFPGTTAKSGQSLRMARRAVRLQAQVRSAAAMLVAPLMRRRLMAVLRSVAITRGALPVLMVDASSR